MAKSLLAAKLGVAVPGAVVLSSTETLSLTAVGDGQVGLAIPVHIPHRHRAWTTARGEVALGGKAGRGRPGGVVLSSTETLLLLKLATARSGLPSPFTSPTATEYGATARGEVGLGGKAGRGRPRRRGVEQHRDAVAVVVVGDGQVGLAIPVHIPHRH